MTVEAMRTLLARDDVHLDQSYLARAGAGGAGLGVALTAIRDGGGPVRSRVAAMGVAPEGRGQGLGRTLLARQMDDARARGSQELEMVCYTNNHRALPLYQSAGFQARRRLLSYQASSVSLRWPPAAPVTLRAADPAGLADLARRCEEAAPPWQLEAGVLGTLGAVAQAYTLHAPEEEAAAGYLILGLPAGATEARIVHVGLVPARRRQGLASAALRAWLADHPAVARLTIPALLPEDMVRLRAWLDHLGFAPTPLEQFEMAAAL
jgi:ribosomal protein S18 acetylase RimI-like enzyme